MPTVLENLKKASFFLLLKLALTGLSFAMIWLDIAVYKTQILETSFTEVTQEVMLFLCAMLFWLSPAAREEKGFNVLAGGFFACLLTRELDGLMDPISHSAWCWPFTLIAAASILIAFNEKNRSATLVAIAAFTKGPTFGALTTGLCVLVFSRVFGMGALWRLVLDDGYARLAKTTVEEGLELLAYSMWLAAVLEYHLLPRMTEFRLPGSPATKPELSSISSRA